MTPELSRAAFGAPAPQRHVFIFVNGIKTDPEDPRAWTDRAVRWFGNLDHPDIATDRFEYHCYALTRWIHQARRAAELAEVIAEFPKGRLHLVGHSNGCALLARALALSSRYVDTLHLISAAMERDFRKNGLGPRIARGQIGRTVCYCSGGDLILRRLAPLSRTLTLGLAGYGDLGAKGPPLEHWPERTDVHWDDTMGHGDWFLPENFDQTMRLVRDHALYDL